MAVEINEGREGKPVGTLFVVGDARKVIQSSHSTGFDPVVDTIVVNGSLTMVAFGKG